MEQESEKDINLLCWVFTGIRRLMRDTLNTLISFIIKGLYTIIEIKIIRRKKISSSLEKFLRYAV
jgi:hypothetical protein